MSPRGRLPLCRNCDFLSTRDGRAGGRGRRQPVVQRSRPARPAPRRARINRVRGGLVSIHRPRNAEGSESTPVHDGRMNVTDSAPSFAADIKPLFREGDRAAMKFAFDLGTTTTWQRTRTRSSRPSRKGRCPVTKPGRRRTSTGFAPGSRAARRPRTIAAAPGDTFNGPCHAGDPHFGEGRNPWATACTASPR